MAWAVGERCAPDAPPTPVPGFETIVAHAAAGFVPGCPGNVAPGGRIRERDAARCRHQCGAGEDRDAKTRELRPAALRPSSSCEWFAPREYASRFWARPTDQGSARGLRRASG